LSKELEKIYCPNMQFLLYSVSSPTVTFGLEKKRGETWHYGRGWTWKM